MSDEKKSYFKITGMSDSFRVYENEIDPDIQASENDRFDLQLWQVRAELAIAQQLSIIAGHLGKIVEESESLREQRLNKMTPRKNGD